MKSIIILLIRLYQILLSPFVGRNCRFIPTCSAYAIECLKAHGTIHGIKLAVGRILRCRPGRPGGYDPVPSVLNKRD